MKSIRMQAKVPKTCYACDQPATTREHVPPSSFFPDGYRNNLMTVPSCELHNNAHAMDVEYARNVISTYFGVNDVGQGHFFDKALRSFDHTPALLHTSFSDIQPVRVQGLVVGAFTADVERIKTVMNACLTALHFRETHDRIRRWEIVLPDLGFGGDTTPEEAAEWHQLLSLFFRLPFQVRQTSAPDVFQYAVAEISGGRVYSMRFYKSFRVFGLRGAEVDG